MSAAAAERAPRLAPTIRPARIADLDALVALEHAAFAGDRAERRALRHAIRSPSMSLLVAVAQERDGDLLIGAATLERRKTSRIARLSSIAVSPARAGQGLGAQLLAAAEADSRRHGRTRLRLEVRVDNGPAIRLYERSGYVRYGAKPDYYEDGTEAWCYEKALSDD
ncbi:GNAT family N-acetyltransferase [Methylobacterium organophilum]|uniref:GNAT family N-acetyltransferase n=1 Tax=Methylobacterium organophilum TaxID=410 RepID=UPI001F13CBA3|nr:N-acetyltransferase [Methylobacterium organophilum]UMY19063.1 GNAT family N-acetyltransferase [Methylobacterium organophilum]